MDVVPRVSIFKTDLLAVSLTIIIASN
jgi:hypothetical protein